MASLVIVAGLIDSIVDGAWDHFAVFLIAGLLVGFVALRAHTARPAVSLRRDLHSWVLEHSNRTGDRYEVTIDRAVAAYRRGVDPSQGHTEAIARLSRRHVLEESASEEGDDSSGQPRPATVDLTGAGLSPETVGGKGAALDLLIAHDHPVPSTGVITTEAYRRFVTEAGLERFLDELASDDTRPEDMDSERMRIDEKFLSAPMSSSLRAEILELAGRVRGDGRLAIRSSATAEDQATASFAGQYRSFLEISDDVDVLRAVRLTWASLWHPAPRSYRRHRGIEDSRIAMAVVVMRLVEATHAGVVFTVDPGGLDGQLRLEYVEGLAEGLVSGSETPKAYTLSRSEMPETLDHPFPAAELITTAVTVEEQLGGPQDIEWAFDGKRLYLVQARPITTGAEETGDDDGFDVVPMPECTYTSAGIGEMLPGVLPPLLWTVDGALIEEGFREMLDELGTLPDLPEFHGIVGRFRGRPALNLDVLKRVAEAMPGGAAAEMERQYFGEVITPGLEDARVETSLGDTLKSLPMTFRSLRMRGRLGSDAEASIAAVERIVSLDVDPETLDDPHLLAYWNRLWAMAARVVSIQVSAAAAAAAAYRTLEQFIEKHLPGEAALYAQRLTSGGVEPCGLRTSLDICDLVVEGLGIEDVRVALEADTVDEMRRLLTASEDGMVFLERFRSRLNQAGSAALFAGPTWGEDEGAAWNVLKQAAIVELRSGRPRGGENRADVLEELIARLQSTRKWKTTRIMTGQIVDMRIRMLRKFVEEAVKFLALRERTKVAVLRLGGEARRTLHVIAGRLAARGDLKDPADLDLLSVDEMELALAGASVDGATLARRRRALDSARSGGPLPRTFVGRPEATPLVDLSGRDVIEGWAASSGRHRGRVRVITDVTTAHLEPGEVLVARATDPSWTPLFLTAGALIVEEGGPLSHAAIVARELGLPAVLNVAGITQALSTGDEVTVDGTAGRILIHVEEEGKAA